MEEKRRKKDARVAKRNKKRRLKGKDPRLNGRTTGEWLRQVVGEAPVILDTNLVKKSAAQLSTYLVKKGYFDNSVTDSIVYLPKRAEIKRKAKVYYTLKALPPYYVDTIEYKVEQSELRPFAGSERSRRILKPGMRFDIEKMGEERDALTNVIRNQGYYDFSKEYINFDVDSALDGRLVRLIYNVEQPQKQVNADSSYALPHQRYNIGQVYFNFSFPGLTSARDSMTVDDWVFVNAGDYPLNKKVIIQNTFLFKDDIYRQDEVLRTYRRLSALPIIAHVSIRFEKVGRGTLDAYIDLVPARRQNVSLEARGTNSAGFFGVEANAVYRHNNIFKGSEKMELGMKAAIQAQALITDDNSEGGDGRDLNTREFGPTLSFTFPKFLLPVKQERFSRSINPSTIVNTGYNFQIRPDYRREVANTFVGYAWNETARKRHQVNPLELSFIRIDKSDDFEARLAELNDRFLSDSYQNHLISSSSYAFTFNDRERQSKRNALFYKGNVELSGNLLRKIFQLTGQEEDSLGSFRLFDVRFSNYIKTYNDLRFYHTISDRSSLAFRAFGGIGVPLQNLNVIPFSKSFFSGGANGLRAWRARTVGPGGFFEPSVTYDKIGDIQLEANVEYRFNLIDYSEGAFFLDAGNIWLLNEDEIRPQGNFEVDRFLSEVAVGGGFGLRLNFDYFLIRFDLASQLKDPSLVQGERWIWEPKTSYNQRIEEYNLTLDDSETPLKNYRLRLNFNLGIGYPF